MPHRARPERPGGGGEGLLRLQGQIAATQSHRRGRGVLGYGLWEPTTTEAARRRQLPQHPAWKKFVDARVEARSAAMPLRGCATLSLPPALLPSVTDSAWFGSPAAFDEDAALTALETAYQQQVRERSKKTESTT